MIMNADTALSEKLDQLKNEYVLEKHRVESFATWPFDEDSSCSKLKMAQAGFYWCGSKQEPDTVTCFVCNKTLDGWENTDEPWKEHAKHAPQCVFVQYRRSESEITVREFLEILGIVMKNKVTREMEKVKKSIQSQKEKDMQTFSEKKG